ncbi:MAG: type II secretion system F family protein [Lachnospiraceae bacterium]|nr:type II secretion system F family protein [Lachnospiraceae bacterium]
MATYKYKAKTPEGKTVSDKIECTDEQRFYAEIDKKGLQLINYKDITGDAIGKVKHRLSLKQLNVFCKELGIMLSAGVPMVSVLTTMYRRCNDTKIKNCYMVLMEEVGKGNSLAEAMRTLGNTFPDILIAMVDVGEQSGSLDRVITDMSDFYAKEYNTRSKVSTMMIYPVMLVIVTVVIVIAIFTFVLPRFFTMFVGDDLPLITRIFMGVSSLLINHWDLLLLGTSLIALTFALLGKTENGRYFFDKFKCNIPVVSKLTEKTVISRFSNTMGILIGNGIPVLNALRICAGTFGNVYTKERMEKIREEVEKGMTLSESMEKENLFENMVWSMLATGEETGKITEMYAKLYEYYESESEIATQKLMAILEPAILVVIGLLIGGVMVSVLLPIYSIYS